MDIWLKNALITGGTTIAMIAAIHFGTKYGEPLYEKLRLWSARRLARRAGIPEDSINIREWNDAINDLRESVDAHDSSDEDNEVANLLDDSRYSQDQNNRLRGLSRASEASSDMGLSIGEAGRAFGMLSGAGISGDSILQGNEEMLTLQPQPSMGSLNNEVEPSPSSISLDTQPSPTGWYDKGGLMIYTNDVCLARDSKGNYWTGVIREVNQEKVIKGNNPQYEFYSNCGTWINNQEYASTLTIIDPPEDRESMSDTLKERPRRYIDV